MRRHLALFLLGAGVVGAAMTSSCDVLEQLPLGACGNHILDPDEDCDEDSVACGEPGSTTACLYVCDASSSERGPGISCPDGLVCGVTDVCAAPSDDFDDPVSLERGAEGVIVRDFDGDGVADVGIARDATRSLEVLFFSPSLELSAEQSVPVDSSQLAAGYVDGDDILDILVGSDAALLSLSMTPPDRTLVGAAFTPYTFPGSIARVVAVSARAASAPDLDPSDLLQADAAIEAVLLTLDPSVENLNTSLFLRNPYSGGTPSVASIQPPVRDMADVVATLQVALVPRMPGQACAELVILRRDTDSAALLMLCDEVGAPATSSDACNAPPGCVASVDLGGPAQAGVSLQLDEDPELELVVLVGAPDEPPSRVPSSVRIIERGAPYAFAARSASAASGESWLEALAGASGGVLAPVLSIADLNADGAPDFVRQDGVYLSNRQAPWVGTTPSYYRAGRPSAEAWTEAASGDFDGNGRLDVVAIDDRADSDIDLLLNAGLAYFNPAAAPSSGLKSALSVGDFDGDGADDLALRERTVGALPMPPPCSVLDDIVLRFGGDSGLGVARTIARLPGIEQMASGRLPRLDKRDSIADFGVVSRCATDEGPADLRVSVFYGATNEQVAAPYVLADTFEELDPNPDAIVAYVPESFSISKRAPVTLAVGRRVGDAPRGAVAARTVVFALETVDAVTYRDQHLLPIADDEAIDASQLRAALGDLDGDGEEELVIVDPSKIRVIERWREYPARSEELEPALANDVSQAIDLELDGATIEQAVTFDLDEDGLDELFVAGRSAAGPLLRWYARPLEDSSDFVDLELPASAGGVHAVAFLRRPITQGLELAVAVEDIGPLVYRFEGGYFLPGELTSSMPDVRSVAAGDVDGDGFEDLIVVGDQQTTIYRRGHRRLGLDSVLAVSVR